MDNETEVMTQGQLVGSESLKKSKRLRIYGPGILYECCEKECTCSYCESKKVGLVLPKCKKWNSWRSIRWYWNKRLHVIRWTIPHFVYK